MARYIVEVEATGSAENLASRPKQTDLKHRGIGIYTFRRASDGKMTTRQEVYENKNGNLSVRHLPMSEAATLSLPQLRRAIRLTTTLAKLMPTSTKLLTSLTNEQGHRNGLPLTPAPKATKTEKAGA